MTQQPSSWPAARRGIRSRHTGRLLFGRLITFPFLVTATGFSLYLPLVIAWSIRGEDQPGQVVGGYISRTSRGTHGIRYRYWLDGQLYEKSQQVSHEEFDSFGLTEMNRRARSPVTVRVLRVGTYHYADALTSTNRVRAKVRFAAIFTLIWDACALFLIYGLYVAPVRARRLYETGVAVPGHILARRSGGRRYPSEIDYAYRTIMGERLQRTMQVFPSDYARVRVGDAVTILYDTGRPTRSVVSEYGMYRFQDPEAPMH